MREALMGKMKAITTVDYAGAGIAIALTLTLLFGVWLPINIRTRQIAASRQTAARQRQRLAGILTSVRALKTEVGNGREEIAASSIHIFPPEFLNQRLGDLATLSTECALSVEEMTPGDAIQAPHFLVIPVRMAGHGSYRNCAMFIHRLHERLPDVEVTCFKLSGTPDESTVAGTFEFSLGWFAASRNISPEIGQVTTARLAQ
jgi:hypothetical protein